MRTTLNLLTRTGLVYMDFQPHLSANQYARLLAIARDAENSDELRSSIAEWAKAEELTVSFEE